MAVVILTKDNALSFVHRLLVRFGWVPDHFAAFLIGSIATGESDELSDIDILVISNSLPTLKERNAAYAQLPNTRTMLGFFSCNSPVLPSNVAAIDKLWIEEIGVDIVFCSPQELSVYDYQQVVPIFTDQPDTAPKPPAENHVPPKQLRLDRLRYTFRILHVHRERYRRDCKRERWMVIDLSAFLFAARDIVLVANGYWHYNLRDPHVWSLFNLVASPASHLSFLLQEIRQMDDRLRHQEKDELMGSLILALKDLCADSIKDFDLYDNTKGDAL